MENLNKEAFCKVETEDEIGILAANVNSLYENLLNNMMEELESLPKKAPDIMIYLKGSLKLL